MDPILLPTMQDEIEAVQRGVIGVMHVLVEIAQDDDVTVDDRLNAVAMLLAYAQEAHPYYLQLEDEDETDEDDGDKSDESDDGSGEGEQGSKVRSGTDGGDGRNRRSLRFWKH